MNITDVTKLTKGQPTKVLNFVNLIYYFMLIKTVVLLHKQCGVCAWLNKLSIYYNWICSYRYFRYLCFLISATKIVRGFYCIPVN